MGCPPKRGLAEITTGGNFSYVIYLPLLIVYKLIYKSLPKYLRSETFLVKISVQKA